MNKDWPLLTDPMNQLVKALNKAHESSRSYFIRQYFMKKKRLYATLTCWGGYVFLVSNKSIKIIKKIIITDKGCSDFSHS